jgi:hypothetical protein
MRPDEYMLDMLGECIARIFVFVAGLCLIYSGALMLLYVTAKAVMP